jgi:hypothetical protein
MVSAVGTGPSALAPVLSPSKSSSSSAAAFQQAIDQYTQDTTSGAGGASSGGNPTQTLSSDLMSTLLQAQF